MTKDRPNVPTITSCRVGLSLVGMAGFTILYLLRVNMSMAIVCMVKPPKSLSPSNSSSLSNYSTTLTPNISYVTPTEEATYDDVCGYTKDKNDLGRIIGEFEWSKSVRGLILSSFFYGYILTQIIGGWLAERYGGKHVMGIGMLVSIISTFLVPPIARLGVYGVIALRIINGMGSGVVFPAMHSIWAKWAPPLERSKLIATCYAGTMLGTIAALLLSGLLCATGIDNGWPLIFYVYGGVGFIWWICWNIFVFNTPQEHPRITAAERDYITTSISSNVYRKKVVVPWKNILKSAPVWAIITAHSCNNWGSYTILTSIPTYMREVLKFDIKQNGALTALPYILMFLASVTGAHVADWIRANRWLSTTNVRKCFQNVAFIPVAAFIVAMGFMDCERRYLAVAFLSLGVTFTAMCRSAYSVNHVDIAPRYAGILVGISNTAATVPGMVAPSIASLLTKNGTKEEWRNVFFICAAIYVFGAIIYTVCGSGEEQAWAGSVEKTGQEVSVREETATPLVK